MAIFKLSSRASIVARNSGLTWSLRNTPIPVRSQSAQYGRLSRARNNLMKYFFMVLLFYRGVVLFMFLCNAIRSLLEPAVRDPPVLEDHELPYECRVRLVLGHVRRHPDRPAPVVVDAPSPFVAEDPLRIPEEPPPDPEQSEPGRRETRPASVRLGERPRRYHLEIVMVDQPVTRPLVLHGIVDPALPEEERRPWHETVSSYVIEYLVERRVV